MTRCCRRRGGTPVSTHRPTQLVAYYIKTADDSPRDYRWPMLVAKLHTQFEDFPAAIAAYARAIAIRPDRADFHTAQAALERAVDALRRCRRQLHEGVRADVSRPAVDGEDRRAARASGAGGRGGQGAADRARRGTSRAAGAVLRRRRPSRTMADARGGESARPTRARGWRLRRSSCRTGAPTSASTCGCVKTRPRSTGCSSCGARRSRRCRRTPTGRRSTTRCRRVCSRWARSPLASYGPEEKRAFAAFLEQKTDDRRAGRLRGVARAARRAGRLRRSRGPLARRADEGEPRRMSNDDMRRLVQLQTERMRFLELATAARGVGGAPPSPAVEASFEAADAYRKAGDPAGEFRMLSGSGPAGSVDDRYFELLLERDPQRLIALAGPGPGTGNATMRDAVANFIVARRNRRSGARRRARPRPGAAACLDAGVHRARGLAFFARRRDHDRRVPAPCWASARSASG